VSNKYSEYPQNYDGPEQICRRLMANHGDIGKIREIISMSGCTNATKMGCYDFLDELEAPAVDVMAVNGDVYDIGEFDEYKQ
jgi:hypothetical protein